MLINPEKPRLASTKIREFIIRSINSGEDGLHTLHENWNSLNKSLGVENQTLIDLWFDKFLRLFSEPWRHYHNFNRVEALLQLIPEIKVPYILYLFALNMKYITKNPAKDENILGVLAWFYGAVNVPMRRDNEEVGFKIVRQSLIFFGLNIEIGMPLFRLHQ